MTNDSISTTFKPLTMLLKLLGLSRLQRNYIGVCYTLLLAAATVFCSLRSTINFALAFTGKTVDWSIQVYTTNVLIAMSNGLCLAMLLSASLCDRGDLQVVYQTLEKQKKQTGSDSNKNLKRHIVLEVIAIAITLLVMLREDWSQINHAYTHTFILFTYFSYFAQGLTTIHFVNLVLILRRHTLDINDKLAKLFDEKYDSDDFVPRTEIPFGKLHTVNSGRNVAPTLSGEIERLRTMHFKLQLAADSINKHFGVRLVGILLAVLIELVTSLYLLAYSATKPNVFSTNMYVNLAFWLAQKLGVLFAVTIASHAATKASAATLTLVLQCLLSRFPKGKVGAQLHGFVLQLIGKKMAFSAGGLFEVDAALLTTVAATVTTYIVVLLTAK